MPLWGRTSLTYYSPYRWSQLHFWPKMTFQKQNSDCVCLSLKPLSWISTALKKNAKIFPRASATLSSAGSSIPVLLYPLPWPRRSPLYFSKDPGHFHLTAFSAPCSSLYLDGCSILSLPLAGHSSSSSSFQLKQRFPDQMPHVMISCGPFSTQCVTNWILQVTALLAAWCLGVHSQTQSSMRGGNSFILFITESPMPIKCLGLFNSSPVWEGREESSEKGRGGEAGSLGKKQGGKR